MLQQSSSDDPFIVHLKYSEIKKLFSEIIKSQFDSYFSEKKINSNVEFLTRREIAALVKKTPQTISDWVNFEGFPKPIKKIGRENLWLKSEVDSFLINRE